MSRQVVKVLEGRSLELVARAAHELEAAKQRWLSATQDAQAAERNLKALLEIVTGEAPDDLIVDTGTGEIFREASE